MNGRGNTANYTERLFKEELKTVICSKEKNYDGTPCDNKGDDCASTALRYSTRHLAALVTNSKGNWVRI